jgi:hypothetical protein
MKLGAMRRPLAKKDADWLVSAMDPLFKLD